MEQTSRKFATTCWSNKDRRSSLKVSLKYNTFKSNWVMYTTLTLMSFQHVSETLQSSNNKMVEVYQLIRDMIQVEPSKRISLELVIEKLERIYPSDSS